MLLRLGATHHTSPIPSHRHTQESPQARVLVSNNSRHTMLLCLGATHHTSPLLSHRQGEDPPGKCVGVQQFTSHHAFMPRCNSPHISPSQPQTRRGSPRQVCWCPTIHVTPCFYALVQLTTHLPFSATDKERIPQASVLVSNNSRHTMLLCLGATHHTSPLLSHRHT